MTADGGFGEMPCVSIAPSFGLAGLLGGGVGCLAMGHLLGLFIDFTQEFNHFDFTGGYQNSGYPRSRFPLVLNEPLGLSNSEMSFLWMTRPLFGPTIEAALSL